MGLVSATTTPMLLKLVEQDKLPAARFATHHFGHLSTYRAGVAHPFIVLVAEQG